MVDRKRRLWLSLEIAELQAISRRKLMQLEPSEATEELAQSLGISELLARRWHMIEGVKSGLIDPPVIEEFDDALANSFDD